ncbi:MAG: hypothetical protein M1131_03400 [Actinobacteria bacterium]|nr:hypothetical protein [Actinomycetota bacterium]MCL6095774.1 hypothetical protein [Actinomycetota bacterium]
MTGQETGRSLPSSTGVLGVVHWFTPLPVPLVQRLPGAWAARDMWKLWRMALEDEELASSVL